MRRQPFTRDAATLMAASVFQHGFIFLMQALVVRNLAVAEYGRLSFFTGMLSVLTIFGTAGISAWLPALSRRRLQAGKPPPHGMLLQAALASLLLAAANALAYLAGGYRHFQVELADYHFWISATLVPICVSASIQGILIGYGKTREVFRLNFWLDASRLLLTIVLAWKSVIGIDMLITGWCALQTGAAVMNLVIYLRWAQRHARTETEAPSPSERSVQSVGAKVSGADAEAPVGNGAEWRRDLRDALAFLIPSGATLVLPRLLVFLTGLNHSAEVTAEVSVAMIFMSAFGVMLIPYQSALLSHFQEYRSGAGLDAFLRRTLLELGAIIVSMGAAAWLAGLTLIQPAFGMALSSPNTLLGLLVLVFALDAPRALLDVFFVTLLPKGVMACVDLARFLAIGGVFLAPGFSLNRCLLGVAGLSLAANAFKALRVAAYLRRRPV
jgi:O-antigen/teichoic acid export membrane protein